MLRGAYTFLVFLGALLVLSALVCWGFFRYLAKHDTGSESVSPFAETRQLPLGPELQVNPREDWLKYREDQEHSLESYGWENRDARDCARSHRAGDGIAAPKGLPVQSSATPPKEPATAKATPAEVKRPAPNGGSKKP